MGDAPVNPNEYINIYNRNPLIQNYKNQTLLNQQTNILKRNLNAQIKLTQEIEKAVNPSVKGIKITSKTSPKIKKAGAGDDN